MVIWGGYDGAVHPYLNIGGRYNPSTDAWTVTSVVGAPFARVGHSAVWTGAEMIVWGGGSTTGGRYCACASGLTVYRDADGDGYGDPAFPVTACGSPPPAGYVPDNTDCNDADASVHPHVPDVCNAIDDDCDGTVDEDFVSHATTCGIGPCARSGATSCVNGSEQDSCIPSVDDSCNGIDDDCDGSIDEEFVPVATACGAGGCSRAGTLTCIGGVPLDSCVPGLPSPEACDGIDNDCDGTIDNFPAPYAIPRLVVTKTAEGWVSLTIPPAAGVTGYDVVRGWINDLVSTHGDFSSTTNCLGTNVPSVSILDAEFPGPEYGLWYLARAVNCAVRGSFDSGSSSQVGSRDAGILASGVSCP